MKYQIKNLSEDMEIEHLVGEVKNIIKRNIDLS